MLDFKYQETPPMLGLQVFTPGGRDQGYENFNFKDKNNSLLKTETNTSSDDKSEIS
jgi:hypothetical protein